MQDEIADQDKKHALDDREDPESERFCDHVVGQAHAEIALALQHRSVADDIVGAVGQTEKHRDDKAEEQKRRDVISGSEIVFPAVRVTQNGRDEQCQHRRNADRDDEVGAIAQLANEGTAQKRAKLRPFVMPAKRQALLLVRVRRQ